MVETRPCDPALGPAIVAVLGTVLLLAGAEPAWWIMFTVRRASSSSSSDGSYARGVALFISTA
jgi:hypothetical protein